MEFPEGCRYTTTHEWIKREETEGVVGISAHAQQELRDIVFVELPKVGTVVKQGQAVAVIESVKAAFDIYAPVSGKITRVNQTVSTAPQLVNQDCYGAGWLFAIALGDPKELDSLFTAEVYRQQLEAQAH